MKGFCGMSKEGKHYSIARDTPLCLALCKTDHERRVKHGLGSQGALIKKIITY